MSDLHIVSAGYPEDEGVYSCIGTNSDNLITASSTAFVDVQVHGEQTWFIWSHPHFPSQRTTNDRGVIGTPGIAQCWHV